MGDWNLGSVATEVLLLVPNVPSVISGAALERMADRQRSFVSEYSGYTIGSNSIGIKYQEAILQLTIAKVTKDMLSTAADNFTLGEFSTDDTASLTFLSKSSTNSANEELKAIGAKNTFYKANG